MKINEHAAVIQPQGDIKIANAGSSPQPSAQLGAPVQNHNSTNTVAISRTGALYQSIDSLAEQLDNIYLAHMSDEERQQLQSAYQQLDKLFTQSEPHEDELTAADKVFDTLEQIYSRAEQKFTDQDWQALDNTEAKLDKAFEQLDQHQQTLFDQLDSLDQQQTNIIHSQLNEQQGERLQSLNSQLMHLFDNNSLTEEQEHKATKLFEQIDQLTTQAFERLTAEQQQKITAIDEKIAGIFQILDT